MLITIDTTKETSADIRAVIGFLAHLYQLEPSDLGDTVPGGTKAPKDFPDVSSHGASVADIPVALQPAALVQATLTHSGNVVNFPVPPPPPVVLNADIAATSTPNPSVSAPIAAAATLVASAVIGQTGPAEYDSSGMPWDARIHQSGKAKRKDGTWKLQKLMKATPQKEAEFAALVQSVTMEIAARKIATPQSPSVAPDGNRQIVIPPPQLAVPPPPPPVTLPPGPLLPGDVGNTVPLPPVAVEPPVTQVPAPPFPVSVPVPPVPPVGVMGGQNAVTFRTLIDKLSVGVKDSNLPLDKVMELIQSCGCPNLQQLNKMPQIWEDLDVKLNLMIAGLL